MCVCVDLGMCGHLSSGNCSKEWLKSKRKLEVCARAGLFLLGRGLAVAWCCVRVCVSRDDKRRVAVEIIMCLSMWEVRRKGDQ